MERENRQTRTAQHRDRPRRGGGSRVLFVLFTLLLIGVCTGGIFAAIFMQYAKTNVVPYVQVNADDYTMALSSTIYYQDSESGAWEEFQTIYGSENRIWVSIDEMPDALWQAAVAIEDQRFFQHSGVDWKRTGGAVLNMFIGMKDTFGGSTITQQLLKNMTKDNEGTVNRKVREIFRALEFEKNYTKAQILELYLNTVYFGKTCFGVETAAEYYFGKTVSELSAAECASLIAITNNPSMYGPMYDIEITVTDDNGNTTVKTPRQLNKQRQENILNKMAEIEGPATLADIGGDKSQWTTFLTAEECAAAKAETLQFTDGTTSADDIVAATTGGVKVNSWFVDQVLLDVRSDLAEALHISEEEALTRIYNSGYRIYTTLDPEIQEIAESVYADRSNLNVTSRSGQQLQSGITILDPYTGNIVAIVGKIGEKDRNLGFSCATARRQVGSSIKPLTVYAPAIESGAVTPGTVFDDYPVQLMSGSPWPKNSPSRYRGLTTVQYGLQHSINTIAIQTLQAVGLTESFAFATEQLGLTDLVSDDLDYGPLGLGGLTNGLTTVEMAAAYATFANGGTYYSPRTYVRVEDANGNVVLENEGESHVAMKESTAYLMNKMLTSVVTGGTGTSAQFSGMTIAGKTGTTSNNYDRYFVGYTPYYVAAVWTGYADKNEKISYDGNPAITMWKKVMQQVHADLPNKSFSKPSSGLTTVSVCSDSGLLPTDACSADPRGGRVISVEVPTGMAPTESCTVHQLVSYCTEGQCLASEFCPESSVVTQAYLDHTREDYGSGVVAEDNAYLLSTIQAASGSETVVGEDGTVTYLGGGCPVHTSAQQPADEPDDEPTVDEPNDVSPEPGDDEQHGTSEDEEQTADPIDGGDEAWWRDFWSNNE